MPQCTTFSRAQLPNAAQRLNWLRPKLLIATAKSAVSTLAPKDSTCGASNSSGP